MGSIATDSAGGSFFGADAGFALESDHRQHRGNDNHCRIHGDRPEPEYRIYDCRNNPAPFHVLDLGAIRGPPGPYDGIIDNHDYGHNEPGQDHCVHRAVEQIEHDPRCDQRRSDGHNADGGDPPTEEHQRDHGKHQDEPKEQRATQVTDCGIDEGCGPVHRRVYLHPGETQAQRLESLIDAFRHFRSIRLGELLDDEQNAGS